MARTFSRILAIFVLSVSLAQSQWTPFRDPFMLSIGHTEFSIGQIGWSAERFVLDSLESTLTNTTRFAKTNFSTSRFAELDVSIFRYNWLYSIWRQAVVDVQSGIGLRIWQPLDAMSVPSSWPQVVTNGRPAFFPDILEIHLDHTLTYPLLPSVEIFLKGGNGFARGSLYRDAAKNSALSVYGWTWSLGGGVLLNRQSDGGALFTYGVEILHRHQFFDFTATSKSRAGAALDGTYISPVISANLSHTAIALVAGFTFGGNTNLAYRGYQAERRHDYIKAASVYRDFLKLYPDHHNTKRVRERLKLVRTEMPRQYYNQAVQEFRKQNFSGVKDQLVLAGMPDDPELKQKLSDLREEVGKVYLRQAQEDLKNLNFTAVEQQITSSREITDQLDHPIEFLEAKLDFIKGVLLYQKGVYGRALDWLNKAAAANPALGPEVRAYQTKIAQGMLDDAQRGVVESNKVFTLESLKSAVDLNPRLKQLLDEPIGELNASINIDKLAGLDAMAEWELDRYLVSNNPGITRDNIQPQVGMDRLALEKLTGPPRQRYQNDKAELWVYQLTDGFRVQVYLDHGTVSKVVRIAPAQSRNSSKQF